jgi:hypothetical protein
MKKQKKLFHIISLNMQTLKEDELVRIEGGSIGIGGLGLLNNIFSSLLAKKISDLLQDLIMRNKNR